MKRPKAKGFGPQPASLETEFLMTSRTREVLQEVLDLLVIQEPELVSQWHQPDQVLIISPQLGTKNCLTCVTNSTAALLNSEAADSFPNMTKGIKELFNDAQVERQRSGKLPLIAAMPMGNGEYFMQLGAFKPEHVPNPQLT